MDKKKLIAKLLEKLSEEELEGLLSEDEEESGDVNMEDQQNPTQHTINSNNGRSRGRGYNKRISQQGEDGPQKRKKSKNKNSRGSGNTRACRVMPMDTDSKRKNKFDTFIKDVSLDGTEAEELAKAAKSDEETRKKRKAFKIPSRPSNLIDVECCSCGDEHSVSASLVLDPKRWKCNDCSCQAGGY